LKYYKLNIFVTVFNVSEGELYAIMTAVHPLPQFNVSNKSKRASLAQPTCRKVSVVAEMDVIPDVSEQSNDDAMDTGFCGEPFADSGELLSSLSPLLFSMKVFGLYFHREDRLRLRTDDPQRSPTAKATGGAWNKLRVYATVVLIVAWLNVFRLGSLFRKSDRFNAMLLIKISIVAWCGLSAIIQTAYYYASHTGKLLKVLLTLPVTPDCIRRARRAAIVITAFAWVSLIMNEAFGIYLYFGNDGRFDYGLAPMVTYIEIPEDKIIIARFIGCLLHSLPLPCSLFSLLMTQVLVYVFYRQFRKLKKNFCRAVGKRGQFTGDLSVFRRRHRLMGEIN